MENSSSNPGGFHLPSLRIPPQTAAPSYDVRAADWAMMEAKCKADELDARLERAGIPRRLIHATFEGFAAPTAAHREALDAAIAYANRFHSAANKIPPPGPALFIGPPGTGKTHLAVAILRAVAPRFGIRYTTVSSLARAVRSTYHRSANETESDILEAHIMPSLLAIDEIGVGLGTDHERAMLHDVVAGRYDRMVPTILLSNLSLASVRDALGERLVDRLREDNGLALTFDWPSFRGAVR